MAIRDLAALAAVPSAFVLFCFWLLEQKILGAERQRDKRAQDEQQRLRVREDQREKFELSLLKSVSAALMLAEATARAVERIPDAHCNGDMHAALEYADTVMTEQQNFITARAVETLNS